MVIKEAYIDAIKELINMGAGKGAEVMNRLLNTHISLDVPQIQIVPQAQLNSCLTDYLTEQLAHVTLDFDGSLSGKTNLIFPFQSAVKLANLFSEEEYDDTIEDISFIRAGILTEIGNIVTNSVMGTLSNELALKLNYKVPQYGEGDVAQIAHSLTENFGDEIILCQTTFRVKALQISGELVLFFKIGEFTQFLNYVDTYIEK